MSAIAAAPGPWLPPKREIVRPALLRPRRRWWAIPSSRTAEDALVAALGTPTAIGNAARTSSGSTLAITTTAAVPSGATVFVVTDWVGGSSVTDTITGGSLSWANDKTQTGGSFYGIQVTSGYAASGVSSGATLTNTWSGNVSSANTFAFYCEGVATSSPLDGTPSGSIRTTGGQTTWTSGAMTTTNADDLLVGAAMADYNSATGAVSTATGSFTELFDNANANSFALTATYRIVASSGSYTATGNWSPSTDFADGAVIVAYKADAGGGGVTVKNLAALGVG